MPMTPKKVTLNTTAITFTRLVAKLKVTLLATAISDWSQKKREIFQRMKRARQWTGGGNV